MNFDKAFEIIIGHEGGYVNDARDPGGETKYGISKRAYPAVDIYNLTLDHAKLIYKRDYWDAVDAESIPGAARLMVFDCAVNCGLGAAKKLLQRAVGTKDDGIIGPKTRAAISNTPDLAMKFAGHWIQYYTDLKNFDVYGKGWVRRVANDLRTDV
jgi:lysozyme family protein